MSNTDSIIIGKNKFNAIFAITEEEQQRGLMWKHNPIPVMAFPFKKSKPTKFWMKNTFVPLDILFCNEGKVVCCHYGVPLSEKLVGPDSPISLVVEFPAGTVDKYKIKANDKVSILYSIKTLARWYVENSIVIPAT
jgi:uncharacterized membrane protein (UPF0127 family)